MLAIFIAPIVYCLFMSFALFMPLILWHSKRYLCSEAQFWSLETVALASLGSGPGAIQKSPCYRVGGGGGIRNRVTLSGGNLERWREGGCLPEKSVPDERYSQLDFSNACGMGTCPGHWIKVVLDCMWMCIFQIIFHSLQLDCLPKKDFCCVCETKDCPFLRSFPVNASVLLTGDEFIIYITFRSTGGLPIRSRGRESREMFSFLESPTLCLRFSLWQLGHVRGAFPCE